MAEPFVSEIRIMSFQFPPRGWALCNGQLLPINQNMALFSLLGTTYGGDGRVNFALPDFRGRTPIHVGNGHSLGEKGGEQSHTLTLNEMPQHTHLIQLSNAPGHPGPVAGEMLSASGDEKRFSTSVSNTELSGANNITHTGGGQAHLNMQPFLVLSFCIALQGIFPSPNY
jgi:microcystin-dependent protein